jgi:hypothetical protein
MFVHLPSGGENVGSLDAVISERGVWTLYKTVHNNKSFEWPPRASD